MLSFGATRKRRSDLNVTSLIDVVFILLIFFMISSTFDKPAVVVDLPEASAGETVQRKGVSVSVDASGRIFLDGLETDRAGLVDAVAPLVAAGPDLPAALYCDGAAPFGVVAAIIDALKSAGAGHVAIRYEQGR